MVVLLITRMVSVSSMIAAVSLPFFLWYGNVLGDYTIYITAFAALVALFVVIKHKTNIQRIIKGTESKLPLFAPKKEEEPEDQKAKEAKAS